MVADPKLFPKPNARGETVSETFQRAGVPMIHGDPDAINGWTRLRSWMQPIPQKDGTVAPSLLVHPDCALFLRTVPTLIADAKNADDIEDTPDANPAKGARYFVMSRPMPSKDEPVTLPDGAIGHSLRALRAELEAESV